MNTGNFLKLLLVTFVALFGMTSAGASDFLDGQVVEVARGDVLTILSAGRWLRVRLAGIQAPQAGQRLDRRSTESLARLCLDKRIVFLGTAVEKDGSRVGQAWCAGIEAAAEQVRRGMAWINPASVRRWFALERLQGEARKSRRGVWAGKDALEP